MLHLFYEVAVAMAHSVDSDVIRDWFHYVNIELENSFCQACTGQGTPCAAINSTSICSILLHWWGNQHFVYPSHETWPENNRGCTGWQKTIGREPLPVISVGPKAGLWASFFSLASPNGKLLEKQQILTWQIFYQVAKIEDLASGI